ncbi:MAG: 50S ribosomal protein L5 [Omnitrophica bacterium RIFCSPHIGHO2_02_FULL_51_18]|nr:MAG: 50S ribosomal protein L5 [Omnitrophica bacterium RIFCSPHIGHO2_02_FULL_51_18]
MTTLQTHFQKVIVPQMMKKFGYKNSLQVPRVLKIVVNMGVGKGSEDIKIVEAAQKDLSTITGQHAVITRAKKAISNFKIREGLAIGCRVTLRGKIMYEFFERLVRVALPRIRDFRGLNPRGFDGGGNFSFGLQEQTIFPEIETDRVTRAQGMDVVLVISGSGSREESYELLSLFGVPFRARSTAEKARIYG